MAANFNLLTFETRTAVLATNALVVLAISLVAGFATDRPEWWWAAKITTGLAALCAVALIVANIVLHA